MTNNLHPIMQAALAPLIPKDQGNRQVRNDAFMLKDEKLAQARALIDELTLALEKANKENAELVASLCEMVALIRPESSNGMSVAKAKAAIAKARRDFLND